MGQKWNLFASIFIDSGLQSKVCFDIVTMLGDYVYPMNDLEVYFSGSWVIWYAPLTVLIRCLETYL